MYSMVAMSTIMMEVRGCLKDATCGRVPPRLMIMKSLEVKIRERYASKYNFKRAYAPYEDSMLGTAVFYRSSQYDSNHTQRTAPEGQRFPITRCETYS
jgi:hypothetical protein